MPNKTDLAFNRATVNLTALRHNFREVQSLSGGRKIMAVVKADAYGHGLLESALALAQAGADALGVADVVEGMKLRVGGLAKPIYVLAGVESPDQMELAITEDLTVFAYSPEQLKALAAQAAVLGRVAQVHVKIDTGMGRLGIPAGKAADFLREAAGWPNIRIGGLATHLASVGDSKAHEQLRAFDDICRLAYQLGLPQDLNSALASPGLLAHSGHMSGMVRPGLLLYGVDPGGGLGPTALDLRPVMRIESRIIQIRELAAGESVSYERTFTAPQPMRLATVPFGYANGLSRLRSNLGWALIQGRRAPLLGRVCMNLSMFDVSAIRGAAVGDEVVFLGRQGGEEIKAHQLANWNRGIPYEVLCLMGRLNYRSIEGSDYEIPDEEQAGQDPDHAPKISKTDKRLTR